MDNLGYCCINLTLKPEGVSTNRKMIKRTFQEKGLDWVREMSLLNLKDLKKVIEWNIENQIRIFRMSSDMFPWMSEWKFEDLPNWDLILSELQSIGDLVKANGLRVGFHPGQYNVLPSPNPKVVLNTVKDLDQHSRILDLMGLPATHFYSLNIHVGGSYGDKESTLKRFVENFDLLSDGTKKRLVVENDDKASQYGVRDLYEGIHVHTGIPITFDFFHHLFCTNDMSIEEAANPAASTWHGMRPLAHYSSSKKINEDSTAIPRAHADLIYEKMPECSSMFDVEIEAKSKELALLDYRKKI